MKYAWVNLNTGICLGILLCFILKCQIKSTTLFCFIDYRKGYNLNYAISVDKQFSFVCAIKQFKKQILKIYSCVLTRTQKCY